MEVAAGGNRIVVVFYSTEHSGTSGRPDTDELEDGGADSGTIGITLKLGDKTFSRPEGMSHTTGWPNTYSNNLSVFYLLEADIVGLAAGELDFSVEYDFTSASGDNFPYPSSSGPEKIQYAAYENVNQDDPFRETGGFEGTTSRIEDQDVPDTEVSVGEQWVLFCSGEISSSDFNVESVAPSTFGDEWTKAGVLNSSSDPAVTDEASFVFERDNTGAALSDEWEEIIVKSDTDTRMGVLSFVLQNVDAVSGEDLVKALAAAVDIDGALAKTRASVPSFAGAVSIGGAFSATIGRIFSLAAAVSIGSALAKMRAITPAFAGAVSVGSAFAKTRAIVPSLAGAVDIGGAFAKTRAIVPSLAGAVSIGSAFAKTRAIIPSLAAAVGIGSAISSTIGKALSLSASVGIGSAISSTIGKALSFSASVEIGSAFSSTIGKALSLSADVAIGSASAITRAIIPVLSAAVDITGAFVRTSALVRLLAAAEGITGAAVRVRALTRSLAAPVDISSSSALVRGLVRALAGAVDISGSLAKVLVDVSYQAGAKGWFASARLVSWTIGLPGRVWALGAKNRSWRQ